MSEINLTVDEINLLKYQRDIFKAEISLYEFYKQAWLIIEPGTPFIDNWHINIICEHLEACYYRKIKRLLINLPPRCGKSDLISVVFPCWVWIHNPTEKFIYASYATSLSMEHSLKCRMLIESEWYQNRWSHIYKLHKGQKAKSFFINDKTGYRVITSIKAAVTGKGGSFLIGDDLNNVNEGDITRESVNKWFSQTWSTRLNDPKKDVMINIQQRYHMQDNSGYILDNDANKEWVHLMIPMEYESSRKCKTIILPSSNNKIWEDPRTKENELLWPERFPLKTIQTLKNALDSYGTAGQLQQRPAPMEGAILKKSWFKLWKYDTPPVIEFIIQSWDTALTGKELSAYSACTTWGIFRDEHNIANIILLSMWRDKVEYPELRQMAQRLYFDYRDNGKKHNPAFSGRSPDLCIIEAKASGDPLIQDLNRAGIKTMPFIPPHGQDKIARARNISPLLECGIVWVPAIPPNFDKPRPYAEEFLQAIACFPQADSRDLIDTMTQAFMKLRSSNLIINPNDPEYLEKSYKEIKVY